MFNFWHSQLQVSAAVNAAYLLKTAREGSKVDASIRQFHYSIGATVNMDGTAL